MSPGKFDKAGKASAAVALATLVSCLIVVAVSAWWMLSKGPGPLENLPDDGLLQIRAESAAAFPAEDVSQLPSAADLKGGGVVAPDERITEATSFKVGETKRVGNLEVTPVAVENGPLSTFATETPEDKIETGPLLVLRLRVKNVSSKQTFHPLDPAFVYPDPKKQMKSNDLFDGRGMTYTYLHPADRVANVIPPFDLNHRGGWVLAGQEFPKLGPGEEAVFIVASDADAMEKVKSPMVWRVKLRKGLTAEGDGVATVIGVAFAPEEIKSSS